MMPCMGEIECQGGCVITDRQGVGADNGRGDSGEVMWAKKDWGDRGGFHNPFVIGNFPRRLESSIGLSLKTFLQGRLSPGFHFARSQTRRIMADPAYSTLAGKVSARRSQRLWGQGGPRHHA